MILVYHQIISTMRDFVLDALQFVLIASHCLGPETSVSRTHQYHLSVLSAPNADETQATIVFLYLTQ
jgi:hypothetical protein